MKQIIKELIDAHDLRERKDGYYQGERNYEVKVFNLDGTPAFTFHKVAFKKHRYGLIDPERRMRKKGFFGAPALAELMRSKWEPVVVTEDDFSKIENLDATPCTDTYLDLNTKELLHLTHSNRYGNPRYQAAGYGEEKTLIGFSRLMPAHLWMYRLLATFRRPIISDPYCDRVIWKFMVRHRETGQLVGFWDYKGSSRFLVDYDVFHGKGDDLFKNELNELVLYLLSDQCSHPYQDTTAGMVA